MAAALARTLERIATAAEAAGRDARSVRLLVATKTQPPERILAVLREGTQLIGENRVQEITDKAPALGSVPHTLHLIGNLQRNKVNQVLPHVDCIQTIDTPALAARIDDRLGVTDPGRELDVMVQVNVSGEESKSGVAPEQAAALVKRIGALPRLHLVGLMTIGLNSPDVAAVRAGYARLRALRDELVPGGELSMGMSGDLEAAVAEGATIVRVGSAVFGRRA
ncbi:MAG: YggS family pyridoxal phosphate-dependent enzyme [Williamsia herbipolensis]|nr:YggS family pyridoxal phosphate-dependent enzyme [Williamsia herbipolensis]